MCDRDATSECVEGALALATRLVEKGADVNGAGADENGGASTPLWWAARAAQRGKAGGAALATLLVGGGVET